MLRSCNRHLTTMANLFAGASAIAAFFQGSHLSVASFSSRKQVAPCLFYICLLYSVLTAPEKSNQKGSRLRGRVLGLAVRNQFKTPWPWCPHASGQKE